MIFRLCHESARSPPRALARPSACSRNHTGSKSRCNPALFGFPKEHFQTRILSCRAPPPASARRASTGTPTRGASRRTTLTPRHRVLDDHRDQDLIYIFHDKVRDNNLRQDSECDFLISYAKATTSATLEDCQCQRLLLSTQNSVALAKHHNRYIA